MRRAVMVAVSVAVALVLGGPALVLGQISFPKGVYYAALGDSVAAGEGALPVTNGYTYQLYERGVFGQKTSTHFNNAAVRGTRSWDVRDHQVPQLLCAEPALRPTVVTITTGAGDFLRGDPNIPGIAGRIADAVHRLLNNDTLVASPVLDPVTSVPCRRLSNVTILVSNYYRIPHPEPVIQAQLDAALAGFDQALRFALQLVPVPPGSRVAVVDLYTPSIDQRGLLLIERRLGFSGPFDFDIHPTNRGHSWIAQQFEAVWKGLQ